MSATVRSLKQAADLLACWVCGHCTAAGEGTVEAVGGVFVIVVYHDQSCRVLAGGVPAIVDELAAVRRSGHAVATYSRLPLAWHRRAPALTE